MNKRYLGIDHGSKRVGLAYADSLGIAFPLPAIVYDKKAQLWEALEVVIKAKHIKHCVVGYPLNMDGTEGSRAQLTKDFAEAIHHRFGVTVSLSDERLTTHTVLNRQQSKTMKVQREERALGYVDSHAAALILQDYLNEEALGNEKGLWPEEHFGG